MIMWNLSETMAAWGWPGGNPQQVNVTQQKHLGSEGFDLQNTWVIFRRCVNRSLNVFESSVDTELVNP